MKKILTFLLVVVMAQATLSAQDTISYSHHQLGAMVGLSEIGISWKARPTEHFAVQTDLVFLSFFQCYATTLHEMYGVVYAPKLEPPLPGEGPHPPMLTNTSTSFYSPYFNVNFLYQSRRLGKHFDWYAGGGLRLGYASEMDEFSLGNVFLPGATLAVGFEWHSFRYPLDIALDIKPFFGVAIDCDRYTSAENKPAPIGVFKFPLAVTFRGRF